MLAEVDHYTFQTIWFAAFGKVVSIPVEKNREANGKVNSNQNLKKEQEKL